MLHKAWNSKGEMPCCFTGSSIKFQGHTVQNITDFGPNWAFPDNRPVAAFKSLRFALLFVECATQNKVYLILSFFWRSCLSNGGSFSWWRHQMETFSVLLAFCAGNSPVTGEFPAQRPVMRCFAFLSASESTVEQTMQTHVIRDSIAFIMTSA